MSGKNILIVKDVTKRFGGLSALKEVSLTINSGEILGLIGPNGAGKTTLFNVIAGMYKPEQGTIIFNGVNITGFPPYKIAKLGIARTFQIPRPFNDLTVFDNVYVSALVKSDERQARKIAEETIDLLGLEKKKFELAKNLTLLERKRLEMARAIATKPTLLLLDEVMAGLKPKEMDEITNTIRQLNANGTTILIVEHIIKAIVDLCTRVVVLDHGVKIAEGVPKEVVKEAKVIKAYLGEEYAA